MFGRCQHVLKIKYSHPSVLTTPIRTQENGLSRTFGTRVFKDRLNCVSKWELGPFFKQCIRQVDYVAAQKLKRGQQWIRFYSQLWSRDQLSCLLIQLGRRLGIAFRHRRISSIILGGAAFAPVTSNISPSDSISDNCKQEQKQNIQSQPAQKKRPNLIEDTISDELITSHTKDLLYVEQLKETTLTCQQCQRRHVIDEVVDGINYCNCEKKITSVYGIGAQPTMDCKSSSSWLPFLERKDILVWRQEHPANPGLYAYKMYGKFDDVSAKEFLEVQLDVSAFRMSWDISTAQCHVLLEERSSSDSDDADNPNQTSTNTNQIYYWEVNWPRFFSNRDYVCARRASVVDDNKEKTIVVYTRSTSHPSCPEKPKNFRVKDYWSVMVIKPFTELDEVGIEFSLTAFENPGLSLPSSITTWVAIRGMPEFMENLRKACFEMRKWKVTENAKKSSNASTSKSNLKTGKEEPSYMETPAQYSSQTSTNYSNAYV